MRWAVVAALLLLPLAVPGAAAAVGTDRDVPGQSHRRSSPRSDTAKRRQDEAYSSSRLLLSTDPQLSGQRLHTTPDAGSKQVLAGLCAPCSRKRPQYSLFYLSRTEPAAARSMRLALVSQRLRLSRASLPCAAAVSPRQGRQFVICSSLVEQPFFPGFCQGAARQKGKAGSLLLGGWPSAKELGLQTHPETLCQQNASHSAGKSTSPYQAATH